MQMNDTLGMGLTDEELEFIIRTNDRDNDRHINFAEFERITLGSSE